MLYTYDPRFSFSCFFHIFSPFSYLLLSFFLSVLSILLLSFHSRLLTLPLFIRPNICNSLFNHFVLTSCIPLLLIAYIPLFLFIPTLIHPFLLSPFSFPPFLFYLNIPPSVSPSLGFLPLISLYLLFLPLFLTLDIHSFVSQLQYTLLHSPFFCFFPSISLLPFLRPFVCYP